MVLFQRLWQIVWVLTAVVEGLTLKPEHFFCFERSSDTATLTLEDLFCTFMIVWHLRNYHFNWVPGGLEPAIVS